MRTKWKLVWCANLWFCINFMLSKCRMVEGAIDLENLAENNSKPVFVMTHVRVWWHFCKIAALKKSFVGLNTCWDRKVNSWMFPEIVKLFLFGRERKNCFLVSARSDMSTLLLCFILTIVTLITLHMLQIFHSSFGWFSLLNFELRKTFLNLNFLLLHLSPN